MKISNHCYIVSGLAAETPWSVNSGFIVGDHTTLIIDTGSNYQAAQTIYGYADSVKSSNKMIVVNTEPHFDHIGGNCFFSKSGIDIFAHTSIRRNPVDFENNKQDFNNTIQNPVRKAAQEAEAFFANTELSNPNKSLTAGDKIDLGSLPAQIIGTPGHTPYNLSVFVECDSVLYCGDCIVTSYIPNLEIGKKKEWNLWKQSLDTIESLQPEIIVPGHGNFISGSTRVSNEVTKLKTILNTAIRESKAPTAQ